MLIIPRDSTHPSEFPKGAWRAVKRDGVRAANLSCPLCGFRAGLGHNTNHEIAADGSVSPSVVCDNEGCSFHDFIKLEGWEV